MHEGGEEAKMLARREGAVGHMIFNNPERHNAVSFEMWDLCDAILEDFAGDEAVRVLVISGAGGKAFVSGADITEFGKERSAGATADIYNARVRTVYERVENFPKPVIAMIDGYCIGGGLNLAVACDVRICSSVSTFGMPAARLGLGYPFPAVCRLIDAVGAARAKDLMFSARRFDAAEALAMGVVQKVVPSEDLEREVADYAAGIAENAPLTVAAMKFISIQIALDPDARDHDTCDAMIQKCFDSADYVEGQTAFREKRDPVFSGR